MEYPSRAQRQGFNVKDKNATDIRLLCYNDGSREDCHRLLINSGEVGAYVIRKSVTVANANVLSVLVSPGSVDGISNYLLTEDLNGRIGLSLSTNAPNQRWQFFDYLQHLIECCSGKSTPLKVALAFPIFEDEYLSMNDNNNNNNSKCTINNSNKNNNSNNNIEDVLQSMQCFLCNGFAVDAVETCCCAQLFCEKCVPNVCDQRCLSCRKPIKVQISHVLRRIIGNMAAVCPHDGCGAEGKRSELKNHEKSCDYRLRCCIIQECNYVCRHSDMLKHVIDAHPHEAMSRLEATRE